MTSGLDEYLIRAATPARCAEVVHAVMGGKPLTSDDADVIRGMYVRLFQSDAPPNGAQKKVEAAIDALENAIFEIESVSSVVLGRALKRLRELEREMVVA